MVLLLHFFLNVVSSVKALFRVLETETIATLLLLLLLEEKLLFVSNQIEVLPKVLEGLSLLLPYPWPHGFIPVIPFYLLPVLIDSPSPFLFGTSNTSFAYIRSSISHDIHVIYLTERYHGTAPSIPPKPRQWLWAFVAYDIIE